MLLQDKHNVMGQLTLLSMSSKDWLATHLDQEIGLKNLAGIGVISADIPTGLSCGRMHG